MHQLPLRRNSASRNYEHPAARILRSARTKVGQRGVASSLSPQEAEAGPSSWPEAATTNRSRTSNPVGPYVTSRFVGLIPIWPII